MATEVKLPEVGEGIASGTVVGVLVSVGDEVAKDQPLIELETDKVTLEFNAPASGTLSEIVVEEGGEVEVGALLGSIYVVQNFDHVFTITSGGLGTANLPYVIYQTFYNAHDYGRAAAAGVLRALGGGLGPGPSFLSHPRLGQPLAGARRPAFPAQQDLPQIRTDGRGEVEPADEGKGGPKNALTQHV